MKRCPNHPGWDAAACVWCLGQLAPSISLERDLRAQHYEAASGGVARTRKSYQRYLKSRGLTDDVSMAELKRVTLDSGRRQRIRDQGIQRFVEGMRHQFLQRAHQLGMR